MLSLFHSIADIAFQTQCDFPLMIGKSRLFHCFEANGGNIDIHQKIKQYDPNAPLCPPLDKNERERLSGCVGFVERWLDHFVFRLPEIRSATLRCLNHPEMAHIELAWNRIVVRNFFRNEYFLFYPEKKKKDIASPLFFAGFRNMMGSFLSNFQAIMIHGAAVVRNGLAAVFLAPDEGGKSSVAVLSDRRTILSDDHVILRNEAGAVMVHGTPFGAVTSGPRRARLSGLFILEKARRFDLIPLKPSDALKFLIDEQVNSWFVLPKANRLQSLEILHNACRAAPVFRMCFPKDQVHWDAIDAEMTK